jgi:hypothetical protein
MDGGTLRPGVLVNRLATAVLVAGTMLLAGCWDPFGPVTPEAPTAGSNGKGSRNYSDVPVDFGNAFDSAQSDRISALLTGSVQMTDGVGTLSSTRLGNCLDSLLSPRYSKLLSWNMANLSPKLSIAQDTAVETFDYSLLRSGVRLAYARATWTVVQIGTEWKLQLWTEGASDSGWIKLCQSPR